MQNNILISCGYICCCLQICNLVINMVVKGLAFGQSLMVISTRGILLYENVSPLYYDYGSPLLLFTRKLHCLQTF